MTNTVLQLDNVEFRRNRRVIITDVNLIIHAGERWVLFGPNGIGKSTAVGMLATRTFPSEGRVFILGHQLGKYDVFKLRTRIGLASADLGRQFPEFEDPLDAVVTGPFDKETVQSDEFGYTGHTEYFGAELEGEPMMIMCSDRLRVGLVTKHIPVSEIARSISKEKIVRDLATLRRSLVEDFGVVEPRIAVMALNPHAGDGGLVGREEEETIRPAIVEAFGQGILAFGPFAADGLFAGGGYAKYDGILAMYHDQGLAPFKTLTPDGVNYTAGLYEVRTSPDHGVAYDIAGRDKADPQSMRNAIYAALDIVENRRRWAAMSADPLQHFERDRGRDASAKDLPEMREGRHD